MFSYLYQQKMPLHQLLITVMSQQRRTDYRYLKAFIVFVQSQQSITKNHYQVQPVSVIPCFCEVVPYHWSQGLPKKDLSRRNVKCCCLNVNSLNWVKDQTDTDLLWLAYRGEKVDSVQRCRQFCTHWSVIHLYWIKMTAHLAYFDSSLFWKHISIFNHSDELIIN